MAHYAQLDSNNIVVNVFVGRDEDDLVEGIEDWEEYYSTDEFRVKRTSYNTYGNVHSGGGVPFRGNYAGIGYTYMEDLDVFVAPSLFPSWPLNENTFLWEAPVPMPEDGKSYLWDEKTTSWVES